MERKKKMKRKNEFIEIGKSDSKKIFKKKKKNNRSEVTIIVILAIFFIVVVVANLISYLQKGV